MPGNRASLSFSRTFFSERPASVLHSLPKMAMVRRLRQHDDSSNGRYFLTICTHCQRPLLTAPTAVLVERELLALPARFRGISIDCWKIMPDHVHVLLALNDCRATVSEIIQAFKSLSTRVVRQTGATGRVWQRGFHDRIVRRELNLERLREYIRNNEAVHAKRRK